MKKPKFISTRDILEYKCKDCKKVTQWRYLDCEDCQRTNKQCIWVCCECGGEDKQ